MSDAYSISFRDGNFDPTRPARVLPTPQRWRGGYGLKNLGRGGNGYYLTRPAYIYKNAIRVFIFISTYIYKNAIRVTHIYILIFSIASSLSLSLSLSLFSILFLTNIQQKKNSLTPPSTPRSLTPLPGPPTLSLSLPQAAFTPTSLSRHRPPSITDPTSICYMLAQLIHVCEFFFSPISTLRKYM